MPWKTGEDEGVNPPAVAIRMDEREAGDERTAEAKHTALRNFDIQNKDLEEHGYSAGARGASRFWRRQRTVDRIQRRAGGGSRK